MFRMPSGTSSYLANSSSGSAWFLLHGDLNQMGIMEDTLRGAGFKVCRSRSGTYPGFLKEDLEEYKRALHFLFVRRVEGWWNQEQQLIEYQVCTQAAFNEAIGR